MKQSIFLKYTSIIMMLTAVVRLFFGFMMINFFATAHTFGAADPAMLRYAGAAILLIVLCALAELVCGFQGDMNWAEPLLSGKCLKWGAAALALGLAGNAFQWLSGYGVSYVAWLTGAVIPAVFTLAAWLFFRRSQSSAD